jgi:heme/copper-type cytochrome/quinol oxidase subunit 1
MSDLLAVDLFIHDTYFIIGWPQAAILGIALLAIPAGIAWAVVRSRR